MTNTHKEKEEDRLDYSKAKEVPTKEEYNENYWFNMLAFSVGNVQPSAIKRDTIFLNPEVIQANIANRDDITRYLRWKERVPRDIFYDKMRAELGTSVSVELITAGDGNKALSKLMFLYDEIQDGETECQNYRAFTDVMMKNVTRELEKEEEEGEE
jgi:hypothetical protein